MNLRIIHLVHDEKFIDSAIKEFDLIKGVESTFCCDKRNLTNNELRFIKQKNKVKCLSSSEIRRVLTRSEDYDVLFIHFLSTATNWLYISLIANLPKNIKVVWVSWGADLYNKRFILFPPLVDIPLFLEETKRSASKYIKTGILSQLNFRSMIKLAISPIWYRKYKKLVERIDFCATVYPYEFDLLKEQCPFFHGKQLFFNYTSLDFPEMKTPVDNNILVGNSASVTTNHFDALALLSKTNLNGRKVIVPLSYGNGDYREAVKKFGSNVLGESFYPLETFLPFEEYTAMINSCSHAIFANLRQQAAGNISLCFRQGVKVFLSNAASYRLYLKNLGYKFYSMENDIATEIITPLSKNDAEHNYLIQKNLKDKDYVITKNNRMITTLKECF